MIKLLVRLLISILIGGVMLYLAARRIDFGSTWSALAAARWWVLLPYFAAMGIQHLFRAWRWGYLLAPIHPVPFSRLLPAASVGFAAIIALPLRMGELVRPYLVASPPELRMSQALGSLAVERVVDGLILSLSCFLAVTLAGGGSAPPWLEGAALLALGIFLAALVVLVMALWQRERAVSLCRGLFGRISPGLGERLGEIARGVVEGFQALPDWRRMLPFFGGTFGYWALNAVAVWFLALGFDMQLGLLPAAALIVIVGVGIMIPAGPGFIGNFELFAEAALGLYTSRSVIAQRGAAFIITFHATNVLWYTVTGALALLSPQVSFRHVWSASTAAPSAAAMESADEASTPETRA